MASRLLRWLRFAHVLLTSSSDCDNDTWSFLAAGSEATSSGICSSWRGGVSPSEFVHGLLLILIAVSSGFNVERVMLGCWVTIGGAMTVL